MGNCIRKDKAICDNDGDISSNCCIIERSRVSFGTKDAQKGKDAQNEAFDEVEKSNSKSRLRIVVIGNPSDVSGKHRSKRIVLKNEEYYGELIR
jgi:hypothetical protein